MTYLEPVFPLLLLMSVAGLIRGWRNSLSGRRPWLLTISIAGIVLLSSNAVASVLSLPLELWYDRNPIPRGTAEAIVVLAGAVASPLPPDYPYPVVGHDTYVRIQHAAWLFKHWAPRPVLACGGGLDSESYSQTMQHLLEAEGVPPDLIWIESRSRSTYENALYGAKILQQHGISRIALVTDATSMPRAAASFRKQGITVVPAAFRFDNLDLSFEDIFPTWQAIRANGETVHEMVGILWYWLSRRI
jgi:uncharacterized SAM-binding protein YcdF (DUF218 family)